jgi:hypothetical protein
MDELPTDLVIALVVEPYLCRHDASALSATCQRYWAVRTALLQAASDDRCRIAQPPFEIASGWRTWHLGLATTKNDSSLNDLFITDYWNQRFCALSLNNQTSKPSARVHIGIGYSALFEGCGSSRSGRIQLTRPCIWKPTAAAEICSTDAIYLINISSSELHRLPLAWLMSQEEPMARDVAMEIPRHFRAEGESTAWKLTWFAGSEAAEDMACNPATGLGYIISNVGRVGVYDLSGEAPVLITVWESHRPVVSAPPASLHQARAHFRLKLSLPWRCSNCGLFTSSCLPMWFWFNSNRNWFTTMPCTHQ